MDASNSETPKTSSVGSSESHQPISPKDDAKVKNEHDELPPSDPLEPDSKSEILSAHDTDSEPGTDDEDSPDVLVRHMTGLYIFRREEDFDSALAPAPETEADGAERFSHVHILSQMLDQQVNLDELLPPPCAICGLDSKLCITSRFNKNGNACRPFYICPDCPWEDRWVTWGDALGVGDVEGECECGFPVRLDHVGVGKVGTVPGAAGLAAQGSKKGTAGDGFYCCAAGACGYWAWE